MGARALLKLHVRSLVLLASRCSHQVVSNGLLKWCKRLERFKARSGAQSIEVKNPGCITRMVQRLQTIVDGEDKHSWRHFFASGLRSFLLCIVLRAHGFVLGFVVSQFATRLSMCSHEV